MKFLAAQLINDGDVIIIDSSSTALKMVSSLRGKERLTVITNGAKAAIELDEMSSCKDVDRRLFNKLLVLLM